MEYIEVGKIINTFGIKGEVKVRSFSDFNDERFKVGNEIYLDLDNNRVAKVIKSYRVHKNMVLISFEDEQDINKVIGYVNHSVYIPKSSRSELSKDEYYFEQLLNLDVIVDNLRIGQVIEVMDLPSNPVLRIKTIEKDVLIPFVSAFIADVNLEKKEIVVNYIKGLL